MSQVRHLKRGAFILLDDFFCKLNIRDYYIRKYQMKKKKVLDSNTGAWVAIGVVLGAALGISKTAKDKED